MIWGFPRAKQGLCHTKHGGAGGIILWALLTVFLVCLWVQLAVRSRILLNPCVRTHLTTLVLEGWLLGWTAHFIIEIRNSFIFVQNIDTLISSMSNWLSTCACCFWNFISVTLCCIYPVMFVKEFILLLFLFGVFRPTFGDVTIAWEGLQILTYARHLLPLSSEGSLACHTFCDTGHPFIWSSPRTSDTHT